MSNKVRASLSEKIAKSNAIVKVQHTKRTIYNQIDQASEFRNQMTALQDKLKNKKIQDIEAQMRHKSISEVEQQIYNVYLEQHAKFTKLVHACDPLKLAVKNLYASGTPDDADNKIIAGRQALLTIGNYIDTIAETKYEVIALKQIRNKVSAKVKLSKQELGLLNKVTKNKKHDEAGLQALIDKDIAACEAYADKVAGSIQKQYKTYYENILGKSVEAFLNKNADKEEKQIENKASKQSKTMDAIFLFIDNNLIEYKEAVKSLVKQVAGFLDHHRSQFWNDAVNIRNFLTFITADKFKLSFKAKVEEKFIFLQATTKKTTSEIRLAASRAVLSDVGFNQGVDTMEVVKLIEGLFKNKEELRSHVARALEVKQDKAEAVVVSAEVLTPISRSRSNSAFTRGSSVAVPVETAISPVSNVTVSHHHTTLFGANRNRAETPDSLINRLEKKLQNKLKDIQNAQSLPSISPQQRKHYSAEIFHLTQVLETVKMRDVGRIRAVLIAEIENKKMQPKK